MSPDTYNKVIWLTAQTVCLVFVMTVGTLCIGLFFDRIDNKEIFSILGPAMHDMILILGVAYSVFKSGSTKGSP